MSTSQVSPHRIISRGAAVGIYQGFPDACRLHNGDIVAIFYGGYAHVSCPNDEYPTGGKLCLVRSRDEGCTWSLPVVIYDDEYDNRDPHIAQLSDGTLICSFFSLRYEEMAENGGAPRHEVIGPQLIRSRDGGQSWDEEAQFVEIPGRWACSAPVRELTDGTCLLPVYYQDDDRAWGGVVRSLDKGATWGDVVPIGQDSGLFLAAETDVVELVDGTLYAALRGERGANMHCATSDDGGCSWSQVRDIGFAAHAPHFTRLSTGEILLTFRGFQTNLRVSRDEGAIWQGPYTIDTVWGAYPSTVELKDGTVLAVYYEDEAGSAVRAMRFRVPSDIVKLPLCPAALQ